ncbi:MAG: PD-(D/E)XK nuclease family protein [Candidatus Omnitrophica bacterium]|nr:PD-(D/E)XK nuclease family protein [Candidatus Omnitrophota bacterium]
MALPLRRRIRNLFDPESNKPYKLSRSRLERFLKCPRCFYLDRRLGIDQPRGPAFTLNSAVDHLLKKEFDQYREQGKPHPIMQKYGVDAIPYQDRKMDQWRENFVGAQYHHEQTNLIITGAIDDIWVKPDGEFLIVDYKSTSKDGEVTLEDEWREAYKRQMEMYQWIFRGLGYQVNSTGYFVYANAVKEESAFQDKLVFKTIILPYDADDSWVEKAVIEAKECLMQDSLPQSSEDCDFCAYRKLAGEHNA